MTPATSAAAAPVTIVRFRRDHRRNRIANGSRQAVTGASASQRWISIAKSKAVEYRLSGSAAMALRHTASSARGIPGLTRSGVLNVHRLTLSNISLEVLPPYGA